MTDWNVSERAAALHAEALVWDDHAGFEPEPDVDLGQLARWRDAGVDYLSVNVCYDRRPWHAAFKTIAAYRAWIVAHPDDYLLVETIDDVRRAKAEGRLAIAFDLEGMAALDGEVGMVDVYHRLGVRQMLFAYNLNNAAGGGCHDEDIALTAFGRDVVAAMNRVGMLIDCSHSGYRTTMEAMEISAAPVIFSHSNARALTDHERNIRDDQMTACAATGGVVGVTGIGLFLRPEGATVAGLMRHIDYICGLIGPAHVGIALDYAFEQNLTDGGLAGAKDYWPARQYGDGNIGYIAPEAFPAITEGLIGLGLDDDETRGILGENFLRVAGAVWR